MQEDFAPIVLYGNANCERILRICKGLKDRLGENLQPFDVSSRYLDVFHWSWDLHELDDFAQFQKKHQTQQEGKNPLILEVGSGIGGCARYLVSKHKLHLEAIEIMKDSVEFNKQLNEIFTNYNCFQDSINFIVNDFMKMDLSEYLNKYDGAITQQVQQHIVDKKTFLQKIYQTLKPGAPFFFDEWAKYGELTSEEMQLAVDTWEVRGIPTLEEWLEFFRESGLQLIEVRDVTEDISQFLWERYQKYSTWYEDPNSEDWQKAIKEIKDGYATGPKLYRKISNPQDYPRTYEVAKDFFNKSKGMSEYYFFGIKPLWSYKAGQV